MKLLPYDSFVIETSDPLPEVVRKISKQLNPSWFPGLSRSWLPFTGTVSNDGFKLMRVLSYRNSFQPVICGRLEAGEKGTIVHITMRLHWAVVVFLIFWCGSVAQAFLAILNSVLSGDAFWGVLFFPFLFWFFALGLTFGGFWYEAPSAREDITRVLTDSEKPPLTLLPAFPSDNEYT